MPRFLANRFVEFCGLVTSLLTAILVVAVEDWLNFSFFTLTFWVVVPIGAVITGCLAATGYYFGAIVANRRPTKQLLVSMVVVAGGTFFLIYYLQYLTLDIDGKPIRDYVAFTTYLQLVLTKAEYGLVRSQSAKFEVGVFGYVIAALQLAAFMIGGFGSYLALTSKPFCDRCEKYLKNLSSFKKILADQPAFESFAQRLHSASPPSAEYLHMLKEPHHVDKPKPGAVAVEWTLMGCPACGDQLVTESTKVLDQKKQWSEVPKLAREFKVPGGMPLASEFAAAKAVKPPVSFERS